MKSCSTLSRHYLALLFLLASGASQAAESAQSLAPMQALGFELLLLIPLAALALYLKKRRGNLKHEEKISTTIKHAPPQPIGDGAKAQILECDGERFLVVYAKNGSISTTSMNKTTPMSTIQETINETP